MFFCFLKKLLGPHIDEGKELRTGGQEPCSRVDLEDHVVAIVTASRGRTSVVNDEVGLAIVSVQTGIGPHELDVIFCGRIQRPLLVSVPVLADLQPHAWKA